MREVKPLKNRKKIQILGIRGLPAHHGGFESFAERLAIFLQKKGWQVIVYCQEESNGDVYEDEWFGIQRVHIPVNVKGSQGTIIFDWKSIRIASKKKIPVLTLGYNTAVFCIIYRLYGVRNIINMDGIEWLRGKWGLLERIWFYINEKIGALVGNHLIADHPEIKRHLSRFVSSKKVTVIPYTAELLDSADASPLTKYGLKKNKFVLLIARPEPENSILEIVTAYSQKKRKIPLIVLGKYEPEVNGYHKEVIENCGSDVTFLGAVYDKAIINSLRFYARFYIHGHTVGGTNPSLVEALGASSAILAQDNKFNRWVAGKGGCYFSCLDECEKKIVELLYNDTLIATMKKHSRNQFNRRFTQEVVNRGYEKLFLYYFVE